jgi:hypothetical protein
VLDGSAPTETQPAEETDNSGALSGLETTTDTTTQDGLDEVGFLKEKGLPYKSFDEWLSKHKELESNYANRLQPLNWAANNAPGLLGEFYQKLDLAIKKSQGLPVPEMTQPVETAPQKDILDNMVGQINEITGNPYTQADIDSTVKLVEAAFERSKYKNAFLPKQEYEGEKAAKQAEIVRETAVKTYGDFKTAWEPKLKEMGLDYAKVEQGMESELSIFGIGPQNIDRITPEVLGRALNNYLISIPGGMEVLMKNYAANAQKTTTQKKGMAAVIPKGGTRGDAEVPLGKIDALLDRGDFKGAEAILAKQIEEMFGKR